MLPPIQTGELGRVVVVRPPVPTRKSLVVRFMEKVDIQPSGCWLWRGEVSGNGYGGFRHPETKWAHRASYLLLVGPIPDGAALDHLCYTPLCVNPDHLDPVTLAVNRQRAAEGWSECDKLHPTTRTRVAQRRTRWVCLECRRVDEANRRRSRAESVAPRLPLVEVASGT